MSLPGGVPCPDKMPWSVMGVFSLLLVFGGVILFALYVKQRRYALACAAMLILQLSYGLFQCISMFITQALPGPVAVAVVGWFAGLSGWIVLLVCAVLAAGEIMLLTSFVSRRRNQITRMSVKEATDSLPLGVLCYAPDGRILLMNNAMERFCGTLTGTMLTDGRSFAEKLTARAFLPGCKVVYDEDTLVVLLSDGMVWNVEKEVIPYENIGVRAILVSNITDAYSKTVELHRIQREVSALNARLIETNKNIVALTAEQEILAAKVRIHDEMGYNLLAIKRYILNGGSEQEKAHLIEQVRENIDFLRCKRDAAADDYQLMIETAKKLGVDVVVSGTLPQTERVKQVIAAGIHECFTNILRHARGNRLTVDIMETGNHIIAVFTGNGEPPEKEIQEKGGLTLLRSMTEKLGGSMTIRSVPVVSITLVLPREV